MLAITAAAHAEMDAGERAFQKCYSCHDMDPAVQDTQGPSLANVVGRRAAQIPSFNYSPALRAAGAEGLVWTRAALDKYLAAPLELLPGTTMSFVGMKDAAERAAVIEYLARRR